MATQTNGHSGKTWMMWALALVIVVAGLLVGAAPAQAAQSQFVLEPTPVRYIQALTNMNIRHGPSTRYPIVGKLLAWRTTAVIAITADHAWWQVVCPVGIYGDCFVSANPNYTRPYKEQTGEDIIASEVRWVAANTIAPLFDGPGTTYNHAGGLRVGEVATVTGITRDGLWWRIQCNSTSSGECFVRTSHATPTWSPENPSDVVGTGVKWVMAQVDVPFYSGPGSLYLPVGTIFAGQLGQVTGVTRDGGWWRITCWESGFPECYVSAHPSSTQPSSGPTAAP
jgi:uncharacterized protein YgiM (DUF1202 family)